MGIAVVPGTNLVAGVDEPVQAAYSHMREIRNYIAVTCVAVGVLISAFTWLALKKIIRPYYQELEEKSNEVAAANVLLGSVSGFLHSDRIFSTLAEAMADQLNVDRARAYSYDRAGRMLHFFGSPAGGGAAHSLMVPLAAGGGLVADCISTGGTLRRKIGAGYPVLESQDEEGADPYEAVAVPIKSGEETLGAIVVDNSRTGESITGENVRSVSEVSRAVAAVVGRARAHERLHRRAETLAVTDGLTGLYDQSFLISRLREELARTASASIPLSFMFCEVNGFRELNAAYGIKFGNDVLVLVAETIRSIVSERDVAARFGGSLFSVILPGAAADEAISVAENLRKEVASRHPGKSVEGLQITVGIGITTTREKGISEDEILERCLGALNKAEAKGGDCVVSWTEGDRGHTGKEDGGA
jgi:diguanylate cyclase (GGDEF)-like protein